MRKRRVPGDDRACNRGDTTDGGTWPDPGARFGGHHPKVVKVIGDTDRCLTVAVPECDIGRGRVCAVRSREVLDAVQGGRKGRARFHDAQAVGTVGQFRAKGEGGKLCGGPAAATIGTPAYLDAGREEFYRICVATIRVPPTRRPPGKATPGYISLYVDIDFYRIIPTPQPRKIES